jgi:peptidoglycan-associated lipoprotein
MGKKWLTLVVLILCFGLIATGCPKKTVKTDDGTAAGRDEAAATAAREKAASEAAERAKAERAASEAARIKDEESKRAEAERQRREFEKSLVAKQTPGIEGTVFVSALLKDVYFEFDRYDIRPQDAQILKENASQIMKEPTAKIQIEGHCDERGTVEYNLALGERRANSVKNYLVSLGVPPGRLSTISYGKEMPLDPGHNEEAWAKNRRAHFVVLSK